MKKIISLVLVGLIGITIIPKTLTNEKHTVLESTTSVYTKEEVDSLLSTIRTNITNNTNEITNIKGELTEVQNSLKDYALKTSLNTTNSNIDNLNTVASSNSSKITSLETLYSGGNATASQILSGKTAIVGSKQITGTMANKGTLNWNPTESTTYTVPAGYYSGGTLDSSSAYQSGYDAGLVEGASSGEDDLYNIWQPYGNAEWVAPRDGKIKVTVFVMGYFHSTNMRTITATGFGLTATTSSYTGDPKCNDIGSAMQTGELDVTKGQTFTMTTSKTGAEISRYGAFISYID